jgi:23S rRNA pseudouridine955/2504/2580 synthase
MTLNTTKRQSVRFVTIDSSSEGQRIDNFLMRELKNTPRSYIYRIIRKGEVRVNKKRTKPVYKLKMDDMVRIPPVFLPDKNDPPKAPQSLLKLLEEAILSEDDDLIFINKPSGLAVHGGSGLKFGLIESFRQLRSDLTFVELVHRLDKETSGIVMLAKNRKALLELHEMLKSSGITKYYQTLVLGKWQGGAKRIENKLQVKRGQQKKVQVLDDSSESGKHAESIFTPLQRYNNYSLLKVELLTGRMHQIRTQLAELNHPVLGDSKYGNFSENREAKKLLKLRRLFLHAYHLDFVLQSSGKHYEIEIPLAEDLKLVLNNVV